MTPDDWAAEARARRAAQRPKPTTTRKGQTPEAKAAEDIDKYLKQLDFYVIRTSAGLAEIGGRKIQIGRKGQHDRTCCAPGGYFVTIEIKSERGTPTPAQLRQQRFIERRGGLVIMGARSRADVRAALVARFGEEQVALWEQRR